MFTGYQSSTVPSTNKIYARERIKQLAGGYCLIQFQWDRSGRSDKDSRMAMPTDAQLVMHCFLVFMEDCVYNFSRYVSTRTPPEYICPLSRTSSPCTIFVRAPKLIYPQKRPYQYPFKSYFISAGNISEIY